MHTEELIRAIQADEARSPALPIERTWLLASAGAVIATALLFQLVLGPRPDLAVVILTPRFLVKLLAGALLALTAVLLVGRLSRPGAERAGAAAAMLTVPILLLAAVVLELLATPAQDWMPRLIGTNRTNCLTFIPLLGVAPLAVFLLALRHGAPTRPALAGAVAGLLAGGLAAGFYALHCTDDSPLFVATWYSIAIGALAGLGALAGPRLARW